MVIFQDRTAICPLPGLNGANPLIGAVCGEDSGDTNYNNFIDRLYTVKLRKINLIL